MSLNLNLSAVTHRHGMENASREHREAYNKILEAVGLTPFTTVGSISYVTLKIHLADWNHAYAIWGWFTKNVQDGRARSEETPVDRETLQQLCDICRRLLIRRNRQEAKAALPLPRGFFKDKAMESEFWSEGFWADVESTVEQLGPILENPKFTAEWEFLYEFAG
jgi:hypothetical protein